MMLLITFHSVSSALYLDKIMKNEDMECKIVPVPRSLSSSCGYSAIIKKTEPNEFKEYMGLNDIEWEEIYSCGENDQYELFAVRE